MAIMHKSKVTVPRRRKLDASIGDERLGCSDSKGCPRSAALSLKEFGRRKVSHLSGANNKKTCGEEGEHEIADARDCAGIAY
jgi:hypothetical protein